MQIYPGLPANSPAKYTQKNIPKGIRGGGHGGGPTPASLSRGCMGTNFPLGAMGTNPISSTPRQPESLGVGPRPMAPPAGGKYTREKARRGVDVYPWRSLW